MTVLVVLVAVFLAYNANNGLPFVPTRELKVDVASGADLVPGNEVREGGFLIGIVQSMQPITLPSGQVAGQLTLQLNKAYGRVPVDSTASVRPLSVLGLKYVDLHIGTAKRVFQDGATLPIAQTSVPVQFEDIFQMFDARTRGAVQQNLVGFGDALAGRGSDLNDTIASLPRLLQYLRPVAQYLAAPPTELTRFLTSLEGFMGTVAPVARRDPGVRGDLEDRGADRLGQLVADREAQVGIAAVIDEPVRRARRIRAHQDLQRLDVLGRDLRQRQVQHRHMIISGVRAGVPV